VRVVDGSQADKTMAAVKPIVMISDFLFMDIMDPLPDRF
jgi:hypothetical protein